MASEQNEVGMVDASMEEQEAAMAERLQKSADCSAALAEKLLQGWTLMGVHCPECITPLMRNRQRQLYCVSCVQWVLTEEEAALRTGRNHEGRSHHFDNPHIARSLTNTAVPAVQDEVQNVGTNDNEGAEEAYAMAAAMNERLQASRNGHRSSDALAPALQYEVRNGGGSNPAAYDQVSAESLTSTRSGPRPTTHGKLPSLVLPKVTVPPKPEIVQTQTVKTLFLKMEEIRSQIAITQDVEELKQLFEVLSACVDTINVVNSVSSEGTAFVKPWKATTWKDNEGQ